MNIIKGFKFAFTGIKEAFKTEKNMKVHFLLAILATSSALFLNFSALEWVILAITIGFVFAMEFINTSLEQIVDIVSPPNSGKSASGQRRCRRRSFGFGSCGNFSRILPFSS